MQARQRSIQALFSQPFGLGRRATQLCVRLVEGSARYPFLAFLDLLARRSQRGPSHYVDTLLGVITRETRDCDLLDPELSPQMAEAAIAFAREVRARGELLRDDWLNNGPRSLARLLPEGWRSRLQPIFQGKSIHLSCLGRPELLLSKLFALCDRGMDLGDCLALAPSPEELTQAQPWLEAQDLNPEWPSHVRATLLDLARRLHHGL